MGLPRSTYYDAPPVKTDDAEIVANIRAICNEFEAYGYRRVGAELRHRGMVVNSKKIRRLMREHDLQPKRRRRFVATTDSDHDNLIFPDLARDGIVDGPNQLWVADITYIAIATGFVYLAAILDGWSRRVVGYGSKSSLVWSAGFLHLFLGWKLRHGLFFLGYEGILSARLEDDICAAPWLVVYQPPFVALADMVFGEKDVTGPHHECLAVRCSEFQRSR
jgi:hypothetical protein